MMTFMQLIMRVLSRTKNYMEWVAVLFAGLLYLLNRSRPVRPTNEHNIEMMRQKMRIKEAERVKEREGKGPLYPWSDGVMRRQDPTYGLIDRDIQFQVDGMQPTSQSQRLAMELTIQERRNRNGNRA